MKNKKGVLGLDTVKGVILILLILAIIAIVLFAVLPTLQTSVESIDKGSSGTALNETVTPITTGTSLANEYQRSCAATVILATNGSGYTKIAAGNYTISGCKIANVSGEFVDTAWKVSYTYTYKSNSTNSVTTSAITGPILFFNNVPTYMVLLGVVVIVLIITIVIIAATRFSPEGRSQEL